MKNLKNIGGNCVHQHFEESSKKSNRAITLIALVITILVMLILAGVSIQVVINNDLIGIAQDAVNKTETAYEQESDSGEEIKIENATYGSIEDVIANLPMVLPGETAEENSKYIDNNGDIAIIPKGFAVSKKLNEQIIEDGLVIIDNDSNEFVWIPVDNINSMVMCQEHETTATLTYNEETKKIECNLCKENNISTTDFCGKLYMADMGENFTVGLTGQTYNSTSGFREPAALTNINNGDGYISNTSEQTTKGAYLLNTIVGIEDAEGKVSNNETWYTNQTIANSVRDNFGALVQNRFNEMATSVAKNKGFYVGRYEISLEGEVAQSKQNQPVIVNVNWYQLYKYSYNYCPETDKSRGATSEMIWGCQWDQMMLFFNSKTRKDGANNDYIITAVNDARHDSTGVKNSGQNVVDLVANIYDLEGNCGEYTQEALNTSGRLWRGGVCFYGVSASYAEAAYPIFVDLAISSRMTLYVK